MTERYSDAYAAAHGRFAVIPAVYVLLRHGDEVLLQLRASTGYYDGHWAAGAAGHVEQGESLLQAAVREVSEELGVGVAVGDLEFLTLEHRTGGGAAIDERIDVFFGCRTWDGTPALQEDKASDLRWFALSALPDPVVPHERIVLEQWAGGGLAPITPIGF
ncbi:NUDIX domain-containing protein [Microbacterium sp.]|uniref:NUDIX domain-containing protein n=1 Tax=Microbacterium sp. TaxID=51671 RepID=UPI0028115845|nr:NUDIX domain-containing protein [Microbacterium sp.]